MFLFVLRSIFLGFGLAVDASSISMANGMKFNNLRIKMIIVMAAFYGVFQALMPFLGFSVGKTMTSFFDRFTPWIALVILGALGGKMVFDAIKNRNKTPEDEIKGNKLTIKLLFIQTIATSLDALSVGLIMVEYTWAELAIAISLIAIVTFIMSFGAYFIGKKFGLLLKEKAEIAGGIVLIIIGLEIFISGIFF